MRRTITLLVLVAACSGASPAPGSVPAPEAPTGSAPSSTAASGPVVAPTPGIGSTTTAAHDREPAPDFTLELGEGGSYTLSEGARPVYLVFWAEW